MIVSDELPLRANRFTPFAYVVLFRDQDFTDAVMEAHIRLLPDTPGDPLIDLDIAAAGSEGISFVVAAGDTTVTFQIDEATMATLPAGPETGDEVELWWDLHITPVGGIKEVYLRGPIIIVPGVTQPVVS